MGKIIFVIFFLVFLGCPLSTLAAGNILLPVPFTSQAPLAQWKDQRFQDACEEASVIMAVKWVRGEKIANTLVDKKKITNEIIILAAYQKKNYGSYRDTSATDTAKRLLAAYYNYHNFIIQEKVQIKDIIKALEAGKIVIVPTDGQALKNPNFTPPGPDRHMVLIKGYNYQKKTFITNDPGTRNGNNYEYLEKILYNAIRDYPTGDHLIIKNTNKIAIIISRE